MSKKGRTDSEDDDEGTSTDGKADKIKKFNKSKHKMHSSSSSSFHNEARFNIFEEIYYD